MANYAWDTGAVMKVEGRERAFGSIETCTRSWGKTLDTEEQAIAIIETAKPVPNRTGEQTTTLTVDDIIWLTDELPPNMPAPSRDLHE